MSYYCHNFDRKIYIYFLIFDIRKSIRARGWGQVFPHGGDRGWGRGHPVDIPS
jgi:hypothetical protein